MREAKGCLCFTDVVLGVKWLGAMPEIRQGHTPKTDAKKKAGPQLSMPSAFSEFEVNPDANVFS